MCLLLIIGHEHYDYGSYSEKLAELCCEDLH